MARYIELDRLMRELSVIQNRPVNTAMKIIRDLPTEEVQPIVRGKWLQTLNQFTRYNECSVCGMHIPYYSFTNYCSNCGAKMEESGEE